MAKLIATDYDFQGLNRGRNHPQSTAAGELVVHEQLLAAIEGQKYKSDARVKVDTNLNLAAPGGTLDGVAMSAGDRFVAAGQTAATENGIYLWTGAATPATRSPDASTGAELDSAVVAIRVGTGAGTSWRQITANPTLGTDPIIWSPSGTLTPAASETVSGSSERATQAEAEAGTDDTRHMTPKKTRDLSYLPLTKKFTIGDGTATSFTLTHNWNTKDVSVIVREAAGLERDYDFELNRDGVNTVVVKLTPAPALNSVVAYVTRLGIVT